MKLRLHTICAALVISLNCLFSQEKLPGMITGLLEDLSAAGETAMFSDLAEEISFLLENPVHINSQDEAEIKRLFFLTVFQVRSITDYTAKKGNILSALELSYLPGFDRELAELVNFFVSYEPGKKSGYMYKGRRIRYMASMMTGNQTDNSDYYGSNYKLLSRFYYSTGSFEAFLTVDKDRGEPLIYRDYQPDFLSGGISFTPGGTVKKIIIGDYKVRFGQGLTVWNGFSRPPSPTGQILMKRNSSVSPYTSSDENDFFRGIALSAVSGKTNILTFASMNNIDATTGYDSITGREYLSSFYLTGIHNTPGTILKKNSVTVSSLGMNVNRLNRNLYLGLNAVYSHFSIPVAEPDNTRDIYDFSGSINASYSVDYAYLFRNAYIFGEFALSNDFKPAFLQGISLNPEGRIKCNLLYTRSGKGYNSFYGDASGLSTFNKPAAAIIANMSAEIWAGLGLTAGLLHKKELWYNNVSGGFPSSVKYQLALRFRSSEYLEIRTDIRHRVSERWEDPFPGIRTGAESEKTSIRFTADITVDERFNLQTRIEETMLENGERGSLCYQSASYIFRIIPLELRGRLTVFNTGGYDSRIYTWEDDLLYNPVIRPMYNKGRKSYLLVIFKPASGISIRAKYSRKAIVTGCEKSETVNEYKVQVLIRL